MTISKSQFGWICYDWGNSAFVTSIVIVIFPIYFYDVAATSLPQGQATLYYAIATTLALLIIALLAPWLGSLADRYRARKKMLILCMLLGVGATANFFWLHPGGWLLALGLFTLANLGFAGSLIFYDALLRRIAADTQIDKISTSGYAFGYLGGGLQLAGNFLLIQKSAWFGIADQTLAVRYTFLAVALWWFIFTLPLIFWLPEPQRQAEDAANAFLDKNQNLKSWSLYKKIFSHLLQYPQALAFLVAFLIYNDGIITVYRMATIYASEMDLPRTSLMSAILMVQFLGVPFTFLFMSLVKWLGAKKTILIGLFIYVIACLLGFYLRQPRDFYFLAFLVAMAQGGTQALSRSLFASLVPVHASGKFFGFFAVFEKVAGILGPATFAAVTWAMGSSRYGALSLIGFFLLGGWLLHRVSIEEGQQQARMV